MSITIHPESHTDHALTDDQLNFALRKAAEEAPEGVFVRTITLPVELGTAVCDLHGPMTGGDPVDEIEVYYTKRNNRDGDSRMVKREGVATNQITVVAGPHDGHPCVLFTAYAGPNAPREPWDTTIKSDAERAESVAFWAQHALSGGA